MGDRSISYKDWLILAAVLALASVLLFANLDENIFWDDEAHTAVFAKNILKTGVPSGWDGRNLAAYRSGLHLNEEFINTKETWLQHYLVAGSFLLLGTTTFAGRLPFVLIGLLCLALLPLLAKQLFNSYRLGLLASLLLALDTSFLLFSRNCRYYSLCMLLTFLAILAYKRLDETRIRTSLPLAAIWILLFFTHTLTFLAVSAGLGFMLLVEPARRPWRTIVISGFIASIPAACWVVYAKAWTFSKYEIVRYSYPGFSLGRVVKQPLADGYMDRVSLFLTTLKNYNGYDFFPAIFLLPLLYWALRGRHRSGNNERLSPGYGPSLLQLLLFVLAYTAVFAFTSPQMIGAFPAVETRYMVSLLPIFMLIAALVIARIFLFSRIVGTTVALVFVFTNLLSLVPVYKLAVADEIPLRGAVRTRLTGFLHEIRSERQTPYEAAIKLIDKHVKPDETVFFYPEYTMLSPMFYRGDRILVPSVVIADDSPIWKATRSKLPAYLTQHPSQADWIVLFGYPTKAYRELLVSDYIQRDNAEVYWYDTTRPEPESHTFRQKQHYNKRRERVRLWRKKPENPIQLKFMSQKPQKTE
jgi:Dolichyl-phosphate-mannose-protein mannosyltransferase